jgi:hypothetical protein
MDHMVTQASFLSQLNKFGKWLGEKRTPDGIGESQQRPAYPTEYSPSAFDVDPTFHKGWGNDNDFDDNQ